MNRLYAERFPYAVSRVLVYLAAAILLAVIFTPFMWMLGTSLKPFSEVFKRPYNPFPQRVDFSNYVRLFKSISEGGYRYTFFLYMFNTVKIALFTCLGSLITSSMAAYAFARLRFPGRDVLFMAYLATLMVPRHVVLIPNFIMLKAVGLYDSHLALILTGVFTAYGTFLMRQFFLTIPRDLEEAAVIDGYGYAARFVKIILPLAKPALTTLSIITLLNIWNEYLYALIFINTDAKRTLTLGLSLLRGDLDVQWNLVMAATTLSVLPLIAAFLLLQRFFIEGIALTGIKE